jgi:hypothetical protein
MIKAAFRIGKFVFAIAIATYAAAFGKAFGLSVWYIKNRPTTPQLERRWLFPLNDHGVVHYIGSTEAELQGLLWRVCWWTFLFALALVLAHRLLKFVYRERSGQGADRIDSVDQYAWLCGTMVFFLMVFLFTRFGIALAEIALPIGFDYRAQ